VLAAGGLAESVVTHTFALEDLREAVATAIDKRTSHAIKVVFRP
jgi:threonine dehydrogenase-like Zn-dependent dehydrogenase